MVCSGVVGCDVVLFGVWWCGMVWVVGVGVVWRSVVWFGVA